MKIAHLCLSNFYIDGVLYQENVLVRQHVAAGHDVLVVASTEEFDENQKITYRQPREYTGSEGEHIIRVPYRKGPHALMRKIRTYPGIRTLLSGFEPDVIIFHGTCAFELLTVARYVRQNKGVKFFIDSHADWNNSARNFLSRELLHRRFYGPVLRWASRSAERILCVSTEAVDFVASLYRIDRAKLELFPLGCHIPSDVEYADRRDKARASLGLDKTTRLFLQAGKQTSRKKLIEALTAFRTVNDTDAVFAIAGIISEEIEKTVQNLMRADSRIRHLGWVDPEKLVDLLCACDIYVQPGTQSVTMQQSLGCRCAVILDDASAHAFYKCGNGWYVSEPEQLSLAFSEAMSTDLAMMSARSLAFAAEKLDYRILAQRLLVQ